MYVVYTRVHTNRCNYYMYKILVWTQHRQCECFFVIFTLMRIIVLVIYLFIFILLWRCMQTLWKWLFGNVSGWESKVTSLALTFGIAQFTPSWSQLFSLGHWHSVRNSHPPAYPLLACSLLLEYPVANPYTLAFPGHFTIHRLSKWRCDCKSALRSLPPLEVPTNRL